MQSQRVRRAREHEVERCGTNHDLVQEVLDELLLQRSRGEQAVEIGTKQLGDEIAIVGVSLDAPARDAGAGAREGGETYMSSRGEMKMSLSEMTFSCLRCFSSFSSRYVRLARTGVLKGFMIFLTATFWLVSWSLAELQSDARSALLSTAVLADRARKGVSQRRPRVDVRRTYQTNPNAPMPTGCKSEYLEAESTRRVQDGRRRPCRRRGPRTSR